MRREPTREITNGHGEPLTFAPATPGLSGDPGFAYPGVYRGRVLIDVIHDGAWIPDEFMVDEHGVTITAEEIDDHFVRERDWGASLIAARMAGRLGLEGFARVEVARVLMDFGRFPGITRRKADHLHRFAINYPFSERLGFRQKRRLLEEYYDVVSHTMESQLEESLVKISIHTYDRFNESGTERPATSLLTRSIGYQIESELPWGLFDGLYPDVLAEFTCDRILRDRISLTLEKINVPVAHNYPYCLPEGSLEVRHQVWAWFLYLKRNFLAGHPELVDHPDYEPVWGMLMDTNLRSSNSARLRSYIHMYRRAPPGQKRAFLRAEAAYERIAAFAAERGEEILANYRYAPDRPSSLGIEVRKDLIYELGEDGRPEAVRWALVEQISDAIAHAVATYLRDDRVHGGLPHEVVERHGPWYLQPMSAAGLPGGEQ